jgi:hypothetical protein
MQMTAGIPARMLIDVTPMICPGCIKLMKTCIHVKPYVTCFGRADFVKESDAFVDGSIGIARRRSLSIDFRHIIRRRSGGAIHGGEQNECVDIVAALPEHGTLRPSAARGRK